MTDIDPVEIYHTLRFVYIDKHGKRGSYNFGKLYKQRKNGSRSRWVDTLALRRMIYWNNVNKSMWYKTVKIEVIEVKVTPKNITTYMEMNWDDEGNKIEAS